MRLEEVPFVSRAFVRSAPCCARVTSRPLQIEHEVNTVRRMAAPRDVLGETQAFAAKREALRRAITGENDPHPSTAPKPARTRRARRRWWR